MIIQINRGMEYLTMMKIIHRDLATRNCMLNADRTVVKITDFGLGRKLIKEYYRPTKSFPIPLRWVACECLSGDLKVCFYLKLGLNWEKYFLSEN